MAKQGDNDGMQRETARVLGVDRYVLRKAERDAEVIFADLRASLGAAPICRALREASPIAKVLSLKTAQSASTPSPSPTGRASSPASASCAVGRAPSCPSSCASLSPSTRRRSKWA